MHRSPTRAPHRRAPPNATRRIRILRMIRPLSLCDGHRGRQPPPPMFASDTIPCPNRRQGRRVKQLARRLRSRAESRPRGRLAGLPLENVRDPTPRCRLDRDGPLTAGCCSSGEGHFRSRDGTRPAPESGRLLQRRVDSAACHPRRDRWSSSLALAVPRHAGARSRRAPRRRARGAGGLAPALRVNLRQLRPGARIVPRDHHRGRAPLQVLLELQQ